ncbi:MAG: SHOCT domain-containing protein [Clostridia bacterium]|nr:SHOCT domain-containing protein [Clostridia bacterium]
MKNKIKKILAFIGFTVVVIAAIISMMSIVLPIDLEYIDSTLLTVLEIGWGVLLALLPAVFAVCFIFSENKTLNNFGYAISALNLGLGLFYMFYYETILAVGLIIMSLASVLYFVEIVFAFFGYVLNKTKGCDSCEESSSDFSEVEKYSQMLADGIITEEEYASLKSKIFALGKKKGSSSVEDLKKWKKLFDKNLISNEEFASIKAKILK